MCIRDRFYGADDISVELDGDSFVPVSALNELRRETLDALTEKLQDVYKRQSLDRAQKLKSMRCSAKNTARKPDRTGK